jgi:membrane associated rhomboid family serine protease
MPTQRAPRPLVALTLCVICVVLFAWEQAPSSTPARIIAAWRSLDRAAAASPELWTLAAPVALLHASATHLAANVALLLAFAAPAERRLGHARLLGLAVIAGAVGSALELLLTGHGKLGASGIVFALGTFLVAARRAEPPLRPALATGIAVGLSACFVFGLVASAVGRATYGNVAHGAGVGLGWLIGRRHAKSPYRRVDTPGRSRRA